jgi:hypothetical protein
LIAFFFRSFDHGIFEKVATVAYALMGNILELEMNQKGWIYYRAYTNAANRIV